jgi:hypothetical protein
MFRSGSVSPKKSILKKKSFPEGDESQHQQETVHSADFYPGPAPSSPYLELMGPQVNEIFDLFRGILVFRFAHRKGRNFAARSAIWHEICPENFS